MERLALEFLDPGNARQFRNIRGAASHDDEPRAQVIAAIGLYPPAIDVRIPAQPLDTRVEQGSFVEIELPGDPLEMFVDFPPVREFL